ncbi:hypothetical protein C8R45DRAFT_1224671 [Mycena sanguinolenta]|nr:hypothetical protein C8R45DRAFT_1224671 [Mycena sanguinolenta]
MDFTTSSRLTASSKTSSSKPGCRLQEGLDHCIEELKKFIHIADQAVAALEAKYANGKDDETTTIIAASLNTHDCLLDIHLELHLCPLFRIAFGHTANDDFWRLTALLGPLQRVYAWPHLDRRRLDPCPTFGAFDDFGGFSVHPEESLRRLRSWLQHKSLALEDGIDAVYSVVSASEHKLGYSDIPQYIYRRDLLSGSRQRRQAGVIATSAEDILDLDLDLALRLHFIATSSPSTMPIDAFVPALHTPIHHPLRRAIVLVLDLLSVTIVSPTTSPPVSVEYYSCSPPPSSLRLLHAFTVLLSWVAQRPPATPLLLVTTLRIVPHFDTTHHLFPHTTVAWCSLVSPSGVLLYFWDLIYARSYTSRVRGRAARYTRGRVGAQYRADCLPMRLEGQEGVRRQDNFSLQTSTGGAARARRPAQRRLGEVGRIELLLQVHQAVESGRRPDVVLSLPSSRPLLRPSLLLPFPCSFPSRAPHTFFHPRFDTSLPLHLSLLLLYAHPSHLLTVFPSAGNTRLHASPMPPHEWKVSSR